MNYSTANRGITKTRRGNFDNRPINIKLFTCDFSVKKLSINLPKFYEGCFQIYTEYSAVVGGHIQNVDNNKRSNTVIWNNRRILIEGKSVFYHSLFDKGIITLEYLMEDTNEVLITLQN